MKGLQPGMSSNLEPLLKPSAETVALDLDEDRDVKTERHRVLSGSIDNAIIYLRNLQKVSLGLHKITCSLSPILLDQYHAMPLLYYTNFRCILEECIMAQKLQYSH